MDDALTAGIRERRAAPGTPTGTPRWVTAARLRPGGKVDLLAWSSTTVVVEGGARILPGARVELVLKGERTQRSLPGQVRSVFITAMTRSGAVRYRASIRLVSPTDVLERLTAAGE